ncbi:MAG: hypothetical protein WC565_10735 [Parcubacteria group bacterium]
MSRYIVTMPLTGFVSLYVEAESPKAAISAFWENENIPEMPDEWDFCEHICQGNVCFAILPDVETQLVR